MKKAFLIFALLSVAVAVAQTTPNLGLKLPAVGTTDLGPLVNANMVALDSFLSGGSQMPSGFWSNITWPIKTSTIPGAFTNSQMNLYFQSFVGGCNPQQEWTVAQGGFTTAALLSCLSAPAGQTVPGSYAIVGFANGASTENFTTAAYFQVRPTAPGARLGGINPVCLDGGLKGISLDCDETDINFSSSPSNIWGHIVTGVWTGKTPANAVAYTVSPAPGSTTGLRTAFSSGDGASMGTGLALGAQCNGIIGGTDTCYSQNLILTSRKEGVDQQTTLTANTAQSLLLSGPTRNQLIFNTAHATTLDVPIPAASRTDTIPDAGGNANFGMNLNATNGVYQSKRAVAGCTTAASIGEVCATPITVTWPTAFADTNYSVACSPSGAPTNLPSAPYVSAKANGSAMVNYFAITAAAASWATIDCLAIHD